MTMTASGKIDRQPPHRQGLRDLSDQGMHDQIVFSEAREDAKRRCCATAAGLNARSRRARRGGRNPYFTCTQGRLMVDRPK
jgi:hypothetical protein